MDGNHFDALIHAFAIAAPRRAALSGALGAGLAALLTRSGVEEVTAKKKKRKKKIKRNSFGCVNVGMFCKNDDQCCSGICEGKKGKKKCKAHDAEGCQAGQKSADCGGIDVSCTSSAGKEGTCNATTGNAGYCLNDGECFPCRKDADCQPFCGPAAACIVCADCEETSTGCAGPSPCDFLPK